MYTSRGGRGLALVDPLQDHQLLQDVPEVRDKILGEFASQELPRGWFRGDLNCIITTTTTTTTTTTSTLSRMWRKFVTKSSGRPRPISPPRNTRFSNAGHRFHAFGLCLHHSYIRLRVTRFRHRFVSIDSLPAAAAAAPAAAAAAACLLLHACCCGRTV